ncbi:hypothetical protein Kpho02_77840 [Kitasatospora phosalacinea]|uniref:Transposase n=1 Tax=Kitasatospora phosalacinea TaxID=2065 RepID=A0A9W6QEU3_9ACTN|nr:DUF6262 family protein [Kitasatospora phosalacinea]GLW75487.1 hypothetical protein Kpho02_77840 [Kitasatospora phosalacinea]
MTTRPTTSIPDAAPAENRRIAALRQAAQDKHKQAVQRAEAGIRQLVKAGEEINFRAVARAAGVSLDFLYTHTDLRKRIETLRGQQRADHRPLRQDPSADDGTVIHSLTEALRRERAARRKHVQDLERRLAAAHGELLRLCRRLQELGIQP